MTGNNNLFEGTQTCGIAVGSNGNITADAMLDSLSDNGGTTYTHALLAASDAIDAGGECQLEMDQIGTTRSVCICDIGAFEVFEVAPDGTSCKGHFFVVPTQNSNAVIFEL
jgi:hypothetical protein